MAFINIIDEKGNRRTVDYDRDASFQEGGGPWYERVPGGYFTLTWKTNKIRVSQYENLEIFDRNTGDGRITRHIVTCDYDPQLRPFRSEIIQMLMEAFQVYAVYHGKCNDVEIIVTVDPKVGNLNPNFNFETSKFE